MVPRLLCSRDAGAHSGSIWSGRIHFTAQIKTQKPPVKMPSRVLQGQTHQLRILVKLKVARWNLHQFPLFESQENKIIIALQEDL